MKRATDAIDLPIRCSCGKLRGVVRGVTPSRGNRMVCHCHDCQAFAEALGMADETLDAHGGTDIFQTSSGRVELTLGKQELHCLAMSPRLLRWYAGCCNTPIGNTMPSGSLPFVGLIHTCLDFEAAGIEREVALGPVRGAGFAAHAKGDRSSLEASDRFPIRGLLRLVPIIAAARLRGDRQRSPFFDPATGAPSSLPETRAREQDTGHSKEGH